jgi:hypothetical protein
LEDIYKLAIFQNTEVFAAVAEQARKEKDQAKKPLADIYTQLIAIRFLLTTEEGSLARAVRQCLNQATLNRLDVTAEQLGTHLCQLRDRAFKQIKSGGRG